jgi:hypothetical protein
MGALPARPGSFCRRSPDLAAPFEAGFSRRRRHRQSFAFWLLGVVRQAERLAAGGVKSG